MTTTPPPLILPWGWVQPPHARLWSIHDLKMLATNTFYDCHIVDRRTALKCMLAQYLQI